MPCSPEAGAALCLSEREDNAPPPMVETASWGYVRLRLETYSVGDMQQWAGRLAATPWDEVFAYFMHEPTAPGYAQALMRFAAEKAGRPDGRAFMRFPAHCTRAKRTADSPPAPPSATAPTYNPPAPHKWR